ncbi:MAG: HigA family addiction module antitoxin [Methylorubrum populi]
MADELPAARPNRPPTHPGALLRDEILPAIDLSVTAAAGHLRVTRQHLHRLLAQEVGVSPEMALRLGKFCGNGPRLWLRMQEAFDLWHAERRLGSVVEQIPNMGSKAVA